MFGFQDLSTESLQRVIAKYRAGLDSDTNYPCGTSRATVRRWLAAAQQELQARP